ncbi:MAG: hypothetical protein ACYDEP_02665 [Acidimicrobiales bacterium]
MLLREEHHSTNEQYSYDNRKCSMDVAQSYLFARTNECVALNRGCYTFEIVNRLVG